MLLLFLIITIVLSHNNNDIISNNQHEMHPYALIPLLKTCHINNDCYNTSNWCDSGVICINNHCHKVPSKPCSHTEICNGKVKICESKLCTKTEDCDDGIFCNGKEKCIKGKCTSIYDKNCFGGICSEINKTCTFPVIYSKWNDYRKKILSKNELIKHKKIIILNEGISVQHHSNSSNIYLTNTELTVIIVVSIVIVAFVLIFLMLAVVGRPFQHTTINTGGGNEYSSRDRYDGEY